MSSEPVSHEPVDASGNPATRYDLVESISFAFLLALEALTPTQRAVLLLCEVFDYSAREVADALGISEANARTTHLRARRLMAGYQANRSPRTAEQQEQKRSILERFLNSPASGDLATVESMLAADVRVISDGGGEFFANTVPVGGAGKVAALFLALAKGSQPVTRMELTTLNGLPAVLIWSDLSRPGGS